ncbi:MAG: M42 family metallopeptidase [Verrucomicrobiales bacterium]|nr:M42 family metallopeptidase [Verrucomicrobiales bacterium]
MDKDTHHFLFDLLNTPSPTGFEVRGQRKWANYVRQFADSVESDAYGNAWGTIKGSATAPTIMIEAHADEIGYMIKHITKEGYLQVDRVGGSDWATARGRRLTILGDDGDVTGIFGNTAIHLRKRTLGSEKTPEVHELFIDVGASNPKEVAQLGIRVGHPAVYSDQAELLGKNRIVSRALDNRIGGFIIAQVLKQLSEANDKIPATIIAANAVQEEIGGHGAKMITHTLRPDICIVLDVTHATDSPGIEKGEHGDVELGGGPSLTHGSANHPELVKRIIEVAAKNDIPIQHEASSRATGTDTDSIFHQNGGVPSALISLPLRYMHSVVEVAHFDDVEKTIRLFVEVLRSIQADEQFAVEI